MRSLTKRQMKYLEDMQAKLEKMLMRIIFRTGIWKKRIDQRGDFQFGLVTREEAIIKELRGQ